MTRDKPYTVDDNGGLVYPARGEPPAILPGYTRDPGNRYRLIPDVDDCKYRKERPFIKPCGKIGMNWHCELHNKMTTPLECSQCFDSCSE